MILLSENGLEILDNLSENRKHEREVKNLFEYQTDKKRKNYQFKIKRKK